MTSEAVQEALEDKAPITRDSDVHDKTFEIKAIREENGVQAEITDVLVCERYSPVLYDLKWSTKDDRDIPFVGTAFDDRQKALKSGDGRRACSVEPTVRMSSKIALEFETVQGDTYHFRKSLNTSGMSEGDLFYEIIVNDNLSPEDESITAFYEPTSDTGGELRIHSQDGVIKGSRRAFEGEVDRDSYSNEDRLIERQKAWIVYENKVRNGMEWVECPVVNAYEDDEGSQVLLAVENPLGEATVFEFDVSEDENASYWKLVNSIAEGDPVNLSDPGNTVWLRHRYRSFHNLGVSEHRDLIRGNDTVLSIDVNNEWELRTSKPSRVSEVTDKMSEGSSTIISIVKSLL